MKEQIAMYLRLSLEDVDKRSNILKEESNSIAAQRSLIDGYLRQDSLLYSLQHEGKTIGMDVAFKNLVYDYYSKDLSKKVKSAMRMKQREAKYVNTAPYGYVVDPADKHHLIIEPNTAVVVRRIFMDVLSGKSCTQIAKELNAESIPTPAQAKATVRKTASPKSQWTHRMLLNILANIKYTGIMVNHTRESRFIRDKNQRRLLPEEWFIRENAHEAIVTRDEYQ